jgi:PTH1 family peptidyl-tRNA hydrolase
MKYLIAGLGNIGEEYANTRHNIGFVVADALASEGGATFKTEKYAMLTRLKYKGRILILIKPTTFMNLSGKAIKYWMNKEKIPLENLLVIVDDLDLDPGVLRMRPKGGDGSHNGLAHISATLGHQNYTRLRFGIGSNFAKGYQVEYVLGRWTREEEKMLTPRIEQAAEIVKSFVSIGAERTMTAFNNK